MTTEDAVYIYFFGCLALFAVAVVLAFVLLERVKRLTILRLLLSEWDRHDDLMSSGEYVMRDDVRAALKGKWPERWERDVHRNR